MSRGEIDLEGAPVWSRRRRIGHYGGATDKRDTTTEAVPYAWVWYRELQAMRGSAFSSQPFGLVHAENLGIARVFAGTQRAAEKLQANSQPLTAAEKVAEWVEILAVSQTTDDTRQDLRTRSAAAFRLAEGATVANVDTAVAQLLGANLVRIWRPRGADLDTPPPLTFWPGGTAGPAAYSLGGGAWLSERANLVVEVQRLAGQSIPDFLRLMNVHLFGLLDRMLPSHMTFTWATGVEDGFSLDVSALDFAAMT